MPSNLREREGGRASPELTIQADIGGRTIAFVELIGSCDEAGLNARLDMYRRAIQRQVNVQSHREALIDLVSSLKTLAEMPERERDMLLDIGRQKAAYIAGQEAAHQLKVAGGHRGALRVNAEEVRKFDQQIDDARDKFQQMRGQIEKKLPELRAQVARLERAIAGEDQVDQLLADLKKYEEGPLAQAAE